MNKLLLAVCAALLIGGSHLSAQTAVEQFGQLRVEGNRILAENGDTAQLRGMSMFWSQWASSFYNKSVVDWLVEDWKITVIRASMAVEAEVAGYLRDSLTAARMTALVDTVVNAAIENGIYVIIDWHDHNAHEHTAGAVEFFQKMAEKYGSYPNVIYEIFNEPEVVSWSVVKAYADTVITAIREIDEDNLIVVGTPHWCQDVDIASADPIMNQTNIAYSLHFYAATHKTGNRSRALSALNNGVALFATEWGTCASTGSGAIDLKSVKDWLNFMDTHKLSFCNWSINTKAETASALKTRASYLGGWADSSLSESGRLLRAVLRGYAGVEEVDSSIFVRVYDTLTVPGVIQAEDFRNSSDIQTESTTDAGGGENVGWIDHRDWADYILNVTDSGTLTVEMRVASATTGGQIIMRVDNYIQDTLTVPATGGWQEWTTICDSIDLTAGIHILRLNFEGTDTLGLFNINWISIHDGPPAAVRDGMHSAAEINPAIFSGKSGLQIGIPEKLNIHTAEIFTADGKLMKKLPVAVNSRYVNAGKIKSGFYVLRLTGDNIITRPVLLNR